MWGDLAEATLISSHNQRWKEQSAVVEEAEGAGAYRDGLSYQTDTQREEDVDGVDDGDIGEFVWAE